MKTTGFGTSPAIVGGVRKMPLPIVIPTISAMPPPSPMTRRSSWDGAALVGDNIAHKVHCAPAGDDCGTRTPLGMQRRDFLAALGGAFAGHAWLEERPLDEDQLYVGTYTETVHVLRMDRRAGALRSVGTLNGGPNPSFLAVHSRLRVLYAVNEVEAGTVRAVKTLAQQSTRGSSPCYVSMDRTDQVLLVANYDSGTVALLPLQPDGTPSSATSAIHHQGRGPVADRQGGPHAHCILADPSNRFALAADLGAATHFFDNQERAEIEKIRFAASSRTGGADGAIDIQASAQNRRVANATGNFPGQAAGRRHPANFALHIDAVAVDRAVQILRAQQTLRDHILSCLETGGSTFFRIEIVQRIDAPLPFEPQLARMRRVQIVFDTEAHAARKFLRAFADDQVMVGLL